MTATKELYVRARPVIDRVLELTRSRQSSLVSEACGADEELAQFVRSLLKRQDQAAATDDDIDVLNVLSVSLDEDATPEELGSYKILGRLGAGGMSVVYLAQQPNPRRLVALKVLRRAVSAELLQHEVETLALLRHPGIAQVYEAGIAATPDGAKPFFVMEYVSPTGDTKTIGGARAQTLADHVAQRTSWGVRERLEILARVCDAVNYAHKRGVIHRDLKPTNVLVDHLGQPKVIDFGIAMLAGPQHVESGGPLANMIAGTVPYMSPEQLRGDASKIDLRSDVYALGVMAFQLLAGSLPYDGLTGEPEKDAQIVEHSEPISLSSRSSVISRDVEAIVKKAIAKDLDTRYQTAADLASDIRRFIAKKPVSARRNTLQYRFACLLRRRPVISTATALAILLVGTASFRAYQENAGARAALSLLVDGMERVDPITGDGGPPTMLRFLDGIASSLDARTSLHRTAASQLHVLLGSMYFRLDQRPEAGLKAAKHYAMAADILRVRYGMADARTLGALNNLGMALSRSGDAENAVSIFEEILPIRERSADRRGENVTRGNYAAALLRLKRTDEAMREFARVCDGFAALGDSYEALKAKGWQSQLLMKMGALPQSERLVREAIEQTQSMMPNSKYDDLWIALMNGLNRNLRLQQNWTEARKQLLRMREWMTANMPADNTLQWSALNDLATVQNQLGDVEGLRETQRAIATWEGSYGSKP